MERVEERTQAPIVAIVGPTATGKTAAAVHIAKALDGEIISADSAAVYRGMDVGTAKPTRAEREAARFHLLDVAEPHETFTVARFKELAGKALADIGSRGRRALVVGGTGLYVRVLIEGYGLTATPADPTLRAELNAMASERGVPALHAILGEKDPVAAARIHPNDRVRIVRALEVTLRTGRTISEQQAEDALERERRPARKFAFTLPREELYSRIDARVDAMIEAGLEEEVRCLLGCGCGAELNSLRSLGYKEMAGYLGGEYGLSEAVEAIKRNTRRFAKRQLTWFRAEPDVTWLDVGGMCSKRAAEAVLARLVD